MKKLLRLFILITVLTPASLVPMDESEDPDYYISGGEIYSGIDVVYDGRKDPDFPPEIKKKINRINGISILVGGVAGGTVTYLLRSDFGPEKWGTVVTKRGVNVASGMVGMLVGGVVTVGTKVILDYCYSCLDKQYDEIIKKHKENEQLELEEKLSELQARVAFKKQQKIDEEKRFKAFYKQKKKY